MWMGVRIVEVRVPQVKHEVKGGKPPVVERRQKRRRSHRRGIRPSRVARSTACDFGRSRMITSNPKPRRPGASKLASARRRFVDWVDALAGQLHRLFVSEVTEEQWQRWAASDFAPHLVPYRMVVRGRRHRPDGSWYDRQVPGRALRFRSVALRRVARAKGRSPPPLYFERALCVRLRTWSSGGVVFPWGEPVGEEDHLRDEPFGAVRSFFCRACGRRVRESVSEEQYFQPGVCQRCAVARGQLNRGRATQRRRRPRRGG
jgi:hypothetical protein